MKHILIFALLFSISISFLSAQNASQWRGPGSTGVFEETGLLKEWPEDGPQMLWSLDSLPDGYSSVSVANDLIYFTGIRDSSDVIIAIDLEGNLVWETVYGRAWNSSFNLSRCTPTIENGRAYCSSGLGDIACVDAITGDLIWLVKASEDVEGTYGKWGISESLLLVDDKVIFTPGGDETTMIALNKENGALLWQSKSLQDNPSYTSPILIEWADTAMILQATQSYLIGVSPINGEIFWKFDLSVFAGGEWRSNNQTNTPIYDSGMIFLTSGYDHRSVQVELSEEGDKAYFVWVSDVMDVHHGGVVKLGDYLYGANWVNNRMGNWVCLDWNTGEVKYEENWENKGSIIAADGMLYCYEEKNGNIGLATATPDYFKIISSFKVPLGKGPHWSHLVIYKGVLYVRHGKALMAYSISE